MAFTWRLLSLAIRDLQWPEGLGSAVVGVLV